MSLPSKEDIARKKGLHHHVCACGNDVFRKYKKENILCETCKEAQHTRRARERYRIVRFKKLLEKEVDPFKTKLVINKLKEIQNTCNIDRDELERIFLTYV